MLINWIKRSQDVYLFSIKRHIIICGLMLLLLCLLLSSCGKKPPEEVDEESAETEELAEEPVNTSIEPVEDNTNDLDLEPIDVEAYLEDIGEVESIIPLEDAEEIITEEEALFSMAERGFDDFPLTAVYTMDGEYLDEELSVGGADKYPVYETQYISATEEIWTINIINNVITAYPVLYNLESERDAAIIFSETKNLVSYDCVTNTFFEVTPDESVMIVAEIDRIDAQTLDQLTKEEIDRY